MPRELPKNITSHETAYELGWALGLISDACYVALIALFYSMFRSVSQTVALLAAFFGLVGCAVNACGSLLQLGPLIVLEGGSYLSAFTAQQLQVLALLFLNLNVDAGYVALVSSGCSSSRSGTSSAINHGCIVPERPAIRAPRRHLDDAAALHLCGLTEARDSKRIPRRQIARRLRRHHAVQ